MPTEIFRGEEDIDKSQIIITNHAVDRFYYRSKERGLRAPNDFEKSKEALRKLLNFSTHKNAVDKVGRVRSLIDHGEGYFFRNGRWQFVVTRNASESNKFSLVTVIYLSRERFNLCF